MQRDEFVTATRRLERYYGKDYTIDQLNIMYEELETMSIERYRASIKRVIAVSKYLPKIADILEASKSEGMNYQDNEREKIECKLCDSTGYIVYKKMYEGRPYEFVAVCKCGNQKQYKGWEISDAKHRTKYYTPMAEELGLI